MSPAATRHILLLSPPSLAANPEAMKVATQSYDLSITDFQMIDRLCAGIASLKLAVYDKIVLLPGADNSLAESLHLIDRTQLLAITKALVPGGVLCTQNHLGGLNNLLDPTLQVEALLAGLLVDAAGNLQLPNYDTQTAVPLRLSSKKSTSNNKDDAAKDSQLAGLKSSAVDGVVMIDPSVDFGDDFGGDNDDDDYDDNDELIDEDDLLDGDFDDADQIVQPPECRPKPGRRRRACKDCSCGLSDRLQKDDQARRDRSDKAVASVQTVQLANDDLAEIDFTVQGKVGSCGNCNLGDAFRCDGCPYIGLPAFRPGEEVHLLSNDIQL